MEISTCAAIGQAVGWLFCPGLQRQASAVLPMRQLYATTVRALRARRSAASQGKASTTRLTVTLLWATSIRAKGNHKANKTIET